jgi:hypothetical protein
MAQSFAAQVNKWVQASEARMEAVLKASAQDVFEEALMPRAKGGNLPVLTSFLRNSAKAQIGSMPSGPSTPAEGMPSAPDGQITLTLVRLKPGESVFLGFTANYAKYMEHRYGFVRLAAQQWQQIVNKNAAELRRKIK